MIQNKAVLELKFNKEAVAKAYAYADKLTGGNDNIEGIGIVKDIIAVAYLQGAIDLVVVASDKLGIKL